MEIKVIEIRFLDGDRPLKAFFDIQVGDWIIHDFRIVRQNGHRFSSFPRRYLGKIPKQERSDLEEFSQFLLSKSRELT